MFIRKFISCLIVIVSAVLLGNMAVADTLDAISEGYSLEKQDAVGQAAEGFVSFCGEITDANKLPEQHEGCFSQSAFRIHSLTCDNASEQEIGEFFRSYYNGMQLLAYKNVQIGSYVGVSGLQDPQYYVYTLRRIII